MRDSAGVSQFGGSIGASAAQMTESRTSQASLARSRRAAARCLAACSLVAGLAWIHVAAGPSRFGFSDRVERHLFPEVTSGPAEPAWSPDGRWIAFSMQGDIWKIPVAGGEATALTKGPWWYFEPAWSPDGTQVACTVDTGGNLDLALVPADGGAAVRLTSDASVELGPAWARDGRSVFFSTSRTGGFDIYRMDIATRTATPVITGPRDDLQPAVSGDGRTLAYVSPVAGRLGTGGIWTKSLADAGAGSEARLVHYEESEYRMRPAWLHDDSGFLFGSDESGSNDIARVARDGGNPVVLTNDVMGEFSAAPSPDGASFAFVSNRTGPMTLHIAPIGGGPSASWRRLPITTRRHATPVGRLRGRVVDAAGRPVAARVQLVASDGRSYAPDDGFARVMAVTETAYFHTAGTFEVTVPAGEVKIEALRGFEYVPAAQVARVPADGVVDTVLTLRRGLNAPARGWYSGDTHAHDLHQGRFGLTHRTLFAQSLAEDLHVTNVLIHMDGTRLMGRWADLTGEPSPLSTPTHLLQFSEEFRGGLGHIGMLGLKTYILPLIGGAPNTPYAQPASDSPYLDGARAQGGIAGFMHPYTGSSPDPARWANSLIPVDVALGKGDFYDVASLYSDELASAEMYYRLLNSGFRLAATGGTDNFPDVWRDPPPGTDRTYAKIGGPLTLAAWMAAVKAGRTMATTGPLVFMTAGDREPGDELRLPATGSRQVAVKIEVSGFAPVSDVELVVNGRIQTVARQTPAPGAPGVFASAIYDATVDLPDGGWVAARVRGPASRFFGDSIAFAHTSPVYVVREGRPPFVASADAAFLAEVVRAIRARVERGPWRSSADRDAMMRELDEAERVYARRAGGTP